MKLRDVISNGRNCKRDLILSSLVWLLKRLMWSFHLSFFQLVMFNHPEKPKMEEFFSLTGVRTIQCSCLELSTHTFTKNTLITTSSECLPSVGVFDLTFYCFTSSIESSLNTGFCPVKSPYGQLTFNNLAVNF